MDGNRMTIFFHKGKSRGMGACLHSRDAVLNARETGIYFPSLFFTMANISL